MNDSTTGDCEVSRSSPSGPGQGSRATGRPIIWVLALVGLLHLPSLFNPFVADDYVFLDKGHHLTLSDIPEVLSSPILDQDASGVWWTPEGVLPFYRPLAILTFALEFRIWGMNPLGYHLTNLALHLLCAYLVWRLALRLTGLGGTGSLSASGHGRTSRPWHPACGGSLAAAVIFGIHPVHSEAVLWISGRFDVLVCVIMLSSVLAYLRWQEGGRGSAGWAGMSLACFALGLGCKETALILPGVLIAGECLGWRGTKAGYRFRSLAAFGAAMGVVVVGYVGLRFALFGGMGELPPPYGVDLSSPTAFAVILRTVAQYIMDFVLFVHIDAFYLDGFWADHPLFLLLCVSVAGSLILWAWRLAGRTCGFRVGVVWAALFAAPSLLAMPGERNVYLASAGVALAGASVLIAAWERARSRRAGLGRVKRVAVGLVLICLVIAGVDQVIMWGVARVSQTVYDDLLASLPNPPPDSRIYVVNQCPLNAGGFTQGVKLHYGREDIVAFALALSPQLQGTTTDVVYRTGLSSVKIVRRNGFFFQSFLEKFALFSFPASSLPESARRMGLELVAPPSSFERISELQLTLPGELDDGRTHLFTWDNRRLKTPADLIHREKWPRLVPCPILDPPAAVARN